MSKEPPLKRIATLVYCGQSSSESMRWRLCGECIPREIHAALRYLRASYVFRKILHTKTAAYDPFYSPRRKLALVNNLSACYFFFRLESASPLRNRMKFS